MEIDVLVLPGDGIGPEVTAQAVRVLRQVADRFGHGLAISEELIGVAALRATGAPLAPGAIDRARDVGAALLGSIGEPEPGLAPGARRPEDGVLALRHGLGLFAGVRLVRTHPRLAGASALDPARLVGVDLAIVRDTIGGLYFGTPRGIEGEGPAARATNTLAYGAPEIERLAHVAFALARTRRGRVTSVDRADVLEVGRLWREVVGAVARDYPDVALDHLLADRCARRLVMDPQRFDVILTDSLFGDILSDESVALAGSVAVLPSAWLAARRVLAGGGDEGAFMGLYAPAHGPAPDVAGRHVANPLGAILAAAALLDWSFNLRAEAAAIRAAVDRVLDEGPLTPDLQRGGRPATTEEIGAAVCAAIR